jgi:D-tagatose-1,6-bisphosphate aldolase subunit GatZ/KbaZ
MAEAEEMVAAYVAAGYEKIHLDTSMGCEGEPAHLGDEVTARRAARLAVVAEEAAKVAGTSPRYVVGTEVPVPGGALGEAEDVHVTSREAVLATYEAHRSAFGAAGAAAAFQRVVAVVAHPGVEFDNHRAFTYRPERARELTSALADLPGLVFEAHSTDYQPSASLARLVGDGFAVLKVGPALTFALREALYGLDAIAHWTVPGWGERCLASALEKEMLAHPEHWSRYYPGDPARQHLLRHFSYSDRARYYWASSSLRQAVASLLGQFGPEGVPETLVSQYLPKLYDRVVAGVLAPTPKALVLQAVRDVLGPYGAACRAQG